MISAIREYVGKCPFLDDLARLDVDFLDNEAVNYSIETLPGDIVVKQYADGGRLCQYGFAVCSRSFFGADVSTNVDNLDFFMRFRDWVERMNNAKEFPVLTNGRVAQGVEVLTQGYLLLADMESAKYQVQCKLYYYEEI